MDRNYTVHLVDIRGTKQFEGHIYYLKGNFTNLTCGRVFTGLEECDYICEKSSITIFVAPEEAARNQIVWLRWCHSVLKCIVGNVGIRFWNKKGSIIMSPTVLLECNARQLDRLSNPGSYITHNATCHLVTSLATDYISLPLEPHKLFIRLLDICSM